MKTQNEFLEALEEELRFLKAQEIHEIIKHYREKIGTEIDYGTPEEKVINNLPDPKDIAKEIYNSRGVSYLEIQKKKYRRAEIYKAIISVGVIALMVSLFITISIYAGYILFEASKLLSIVPSISNSLDIILVVGIVLCIDIIGILIYVFLIDLFYVIITHFLVNVLRAFKKTYKQRYKFESFTISGFIKKRCKNNNVLGIMLAGFGVLLLVISIASLATKGYVYKSLSDVNTKSEVYKYEQNFSSITISGTNGRIYFEIDEKLKEENKTLEITYEYENKKSAKILSDKTSLTISNLTKESYGLFGLLDEPTPTIKIKLSSIEYLSLINIELDEFGLVRLTNIQSSNLVVNLDIYSNEIYLDNAELKQLKVENCYKTKTVIANTKNESDDSNYIPWITLLDIKASTGTIVIDGMKISNLTINSVSTTTVVNDCIVVKDFTLNADAGNVSLTNIKEGNKLVLDTSAAKNTLTDIEFDNVTITSKRAAEVSILRMIVRVKTTLKTESSGNFKIAYLKSKDTFIEKNTGSIEFREFNNACVVKEEEYTSADELALLKLIHDYNNYKLESTMLSGTSSGYIGIAYSSLDKVNLTQTGSAITVSNTNISSRADFIFNTVNSITYENVYGEQIYFTIDHDVANAKVSFIYNNETIGTKIYVKYIGASLRPEGNVEVDSWE